MLSLSDHPRSLVNFKNLKSDETNIIKKNDLLKKGNSPPEFSRPALHIKKERMSNNLI